MQETTSNNKLLASAIHVMVVDDSAVIRGLITRALQDHKDIKVVAAAVNGRDAIEKLKAHPQTEVVVLDIEMPEMTGIEALPELLKILPDVKIIMASTLSQRNADISIKALELGAMDYVPKPSVQERDSLPSFYKELSDKVRALGNVTKQSRDPSYQTPIVDVPRSAQREQSGTSIGTAPIAHKHIYPTQAPKALAIASSTGGPQALNQLFRQLKGSYSDIPIFLTQHMPPTFTALLAKNLSKEGARNAKEAEDGETAKAGTVYVAPGDFHMRPVQKNGEIVITLDQGTAVNFCRPAADPMIEALSNIYGDRLLVLVLTGMGYDGRDAAKIAKEKGATIIAQDEATSIVWGMPGAVAQAGICSAVLPLEQIGDYLRKAGKG